MAGGLYATGAFGGGSPTVVPSRKQGGRVATRLPLWALESAPGLRAKVINSLAAGGYSSPGHGSLILS